MPKLEVFYKIFNTVLPFTDFLYILQLEEYSTKRLIKWLPKFFFRRNIQQREKLILTRRSLITLLLSFITWVSVGMIGIYVFQNSFLFIIAFLVLLFVLVPLFVLAANLLFTLVEEFPKRSIRQKATELVAKHLNMKVVVIAGSYGKTTVKNFIFQLAKYSYKTQMLPGNINTPSGIANWLRRNLRESTELLIAEVDTYEIGEIAKSCDILNADIAVLTNIGDQHLERFSSKKELALALSEVFSHSKPNAICICDENTKDILSTFEYNKKKCLLVNTVQPPSYDGIPIRSQTLSSSNVANLNFALANAQVLKLERDFVIDTAAKLELPERRQQFTTIFGFEGIDDSYNISFTTAQAGIQTAKNLATQKKKKLLVITAGIPELPKENEHLNTELGKILSTTADQTIILGSMFSDSIKKGFEKKRNYKKVLTLQKFILENAKEYNSNEWFILLQPELNDLYY